MFWEAQLVTVSKTLWLAAILVVLSISAEALPFQTHGSVGNINGKVTDPKGAPVPQVKVLLINKGTGGKRSAKTDKSGNYELVANLKLQVPRVKVIQTLPDDKPAAPANPQ